MAGRLAFMSCTNIKIISKLVRENKPVYFQKSIKKVSLTCYISHIRDHNMVGKYSNFPSPNVPDQFSWHISLYCVGRPAGDARHCKSYKWACPMKTCRSKSCSFCRVVFLEQHSPNLAVPFWVILMSRVDRERNPMINKKNVSGSIFKQDTMYSGMKLW